MKSSLVRLEALILVLTMLLSLLSGCADKKKDAATLSTESLTLEHETKFGGFYLHMTIDDFLALGFNLGDSVDITLSNGFTLENIPFYNGYYNKFGEVLLVAYPGYPYIKVCSNNGEDLFEKAKLTGVETGVITLNTKDAFADVQKVMSNVYTNDRESYESDVIFANFRCFSAGSLKEDLFYRSASPCDNQYNRAEYVDLLCRDAAISFILDLADNEEEVAGYAADDSLNTPYWKGLYAAGKVMPLDMSSNYREDVYIQKVAAAMKEVLEQDGPFLIHCTEGKDRTGFVCILLEALAGADLQEIIDDYMITYENYYGLTEETAPEKYKAVIDIKFMDMICYLTGTEDPSAMTPEVLKKGAENYLLSGGMTPDQISALEDLICR